MPNLVHVCRTLGLEWRNLQVNPDVCHLIFQDVGLLVVAQDGNLWAAISSGVICVGQVRGSCVHGKDAMRPLPACVGGGKGTGEQKDSSTSVDWNAILKKAGACDTGLSRGQCKMILEQDSVSRKKFVSANPTVAAVVLKAAAKRAGVVATKFGHEAHGSKVASSEDTQPRSSTKARAASTAPKTSAARPSTSSSQRAASGPPSTTRASSSKGKGKQADGKTEKKKEEVVYELLEEGWSVKVLQDLDVNVGAVYQLESVESLKQWAVLARHSKFPVSVFMPRPVLGVAVCDPEQVTADFRMTTNGVARKVSLSGWLHHLSEHKAKRDVSSVFELKMGKPLLKTVVTRVEIDLAAMPRDLKKEGLVKDREQLGVVIAAAFSDPDAHKALVDHWNHSISDNVLTATVRVSEQYLDKLLRTSGAETSKAYVHTPRELRDRFSLVWLRSEDRKAFTLEEAREAMGRVAEHGGLVKRDSVYVLRVLKDNFVAAKEGVGLSSQLTWRFTNIPLSWNGEDVAQMIAGLTWQGAKLVDQSRRVRKGTASWLVRAPTPPSYWTFPVKADDVKLVVSVEDTRPQFSSKQDDTDKPPAVLSATSWSRMASGQVVRKNPLTASSLQQEEKGGEDDVSMNLEEPGFDGAGRRRKSESPPRGGKRQCAQSSRVLPRRVAFQSGVEREDDLDSLSNDAWIEEAGENKARVEALETQVASVNAKLDQLFAFMQRQVTAPAAAAAPVPEPPAIEVLSGGAVVEPAASAAVTPQH